MRQKSGTRESSSERLVKHIRRVTRKQYSSEEKIRIVLDGLRGECSIAELCRREGIAESLYYSWSKEFLADTSKPAISGMAAETGGVLPRGLRGAQVGLDLRAPAAWPALEDMAMMQQAIQQGGDGRVVAE